MCRSVTSIKVKTVKVLMVLVMCWVVAATVAGLWGYHPCFKTCLALSLDALGSCVPKRTFCCAV